MSGGCSGKRALRRDRATINDALEESLKHAGGPVMEAMRYATLGAGQRIRPLLALRIARMLGTSEARILPAALAVELLHAASLVVDDLPCMDDSEFRRGRPATHRSFGEATAILAAFGMVSLAGRSGSGNGAGATAELFGFQQALLATLDCSSLLGGQAADLGLDQHLGDNRSLVVKAMKTAPLFELAVRAGCLYGGQGSAEQAKLRHFGREFGLAFQLLDDRLDGELKTDELPRKQLAAVRATALGLADDAAPVMDLLDYLNAKLNDHERDASERGNIEADLGARAA